MGTAVAAALALHASLHATAWQWAHTLQQLPSCALVDTTSPHRLANRLAASLPRICFSEICGAVPGS